MKMDIKKVCVLGAGLMGNGIAQVCAQAGYEVTMRDIEQRFVDGGRELRAIRKVATLIDLGQADIREFFVRRGFRHGAMVHMERDLGA